MTTDPRERRAAAHAAISADPAAAGHAARTAARIRRSPISRFREATRARTETQQWADFEAAEDLEERERDRRA